MVRQKPSIDFKSRVVLIGSHRLGTPGLELCSLQSQPPSFQRGQEGLCLLWAGLCLLGLQSCLPDRNLAVFLALPFPIDLQWGRRKDGETV